MDIFVVTGTHFACPTTITSYHANEGLADFAAMDLVNQLRQEIDPANLPPVDAAGWQLGLAGAQIHRLLSQDIDAIAIPRDELAEVAGFDVQIEKAELRGFSALAVDDRERATVLAALLGYQRKTKRGDLHDVATDGGRFPPLFNDEIDHLSERLTVSRVPTREASIALTFRGGVIDAIIADRPITVSVVDYNVAGADPDAIALVPQSEGAPVPATVNRWAVGDGCIDPDWIAAVEDATSAKG